MATSTYLKRLKFKPEYKRGFISQYLTNIRFVMLIMFGLIPLGIFSFMTLPRRLNPKVNLPYVSVITTLPGASPDEVESLLTIPIEEAIDDLEDIDTVTSTSQDSVSAVTILFKSTVATDDATDEVQRAVDNVNGLPEDATDPAVEAFDIENEPVIRFSISSSSDSASLITFSENLKDKLEELNEVKEVNLSGTEEEEIQILMDPEKVASYGVNPIILSNQIRSGLTQFPSGTLETTTLNIPLSIDKNIRSIEDIRKTPIRLNGRLVQLSDIAQITESPKPNQPNSFVVKNGEAERAIGFSVFKTDSANITNAAKAAEEVVAAELKATNGNFHYQIIQNNAGDISEQFASLGSNFAQTLALVFLTLFVFLGIRQSLIVALSIPITFLISFSVMGAAGISLNFLSVFSLLLALGLLVDDAIVIVSAFTSYFKSRKFSPEETGILVWRDFIVPIWSTTITTVWAFVPLLLATGIIGEFIKTIPIVVSATLLASTSVAVLITLPVTMQAFSLNIPKRVRATFTVILTILLIAAYAALAPKDPIIAFTIGFVVYILLLLVVFISRDHFKKKLYSLFARSTRLNQFIKSSSQEGIINTTPLVNSYKNTVNKILKSARNRKRVVVFVTIFAIFSYMLFPLGFVVNEFFPKTEADYVSVNLTLPEGTKAKITEREAIKIAEQISGNPTVERVSVNLSGGGSENSANMTVNLVDEEYRLENSIELSESMRRAFKGYTAGELSIFEPSGGPPVGDDISLTILGEDLVELQAISVEIQSYLKSQEGVTNVDSSLTPAGSKMSFIPNERKIAYYGLTVGEVGLWLRTFANGYTLETSKFEGEEKDIVLRMDTKRFSPEEIGRLIIPTQNGNVRVENLGEIVLSANPAQITREDAKRAITVTASVQAGYSATEANKGLMEFTTKMELPEGYEFKTGGANEENERSVQSIMQAMLLATLLILATMVVQLGSYRKAIIVILVIPLAVSGVFTIFALTNTPLSFPALIGVLALFGIVVNNSIMIVEKINQNLANGIEFREAIADAASSRVEPIMFTSLTTIFGLLPITLTDPLWRGLGGAIIAGLTVSGIIMLFFIPTVYYMWFKPKGRRAEG